MPILEPCHRAQFRLTAWLIGFNLWAVLWATPGEAALQTEKAQFAAGFKLAIGHGYSASYDELSKQLVLRVVVDNSAQAVARELVLEVSGSLNFQRSVQVPAYESRQWFWYMPVLTAQRYLRFSLQATDRATRERQTLEWSEEFANSGEEKYYFARLGSNPPPAPEYESSEHWVDQGIVEDHEVPDIWHGLTGYQVLLVRQATLASAPWREVLQDWVLMGGALLVYAEPGDDPAVVMKTTGFATSMNVGQRGAGSVQVATASTYNSVFRHIQGNIPASLHTTQRTSAEIKAFLDQALPDMGKPNHRLLFLILLGFSIVAGPVLWTLLVYRQARPFAYIGGVFVLSVMVSGGVLVVNVLAEGVNPKVNHASLQLLDLVQQQQLWVQQFSVFRPTSLGGGQVRLPPEALLSQGKYSTTGWGAADLGVQWDAAGRLVRGVLPVRQRVIMVQRGVRPLARRLLFSRDQDLAQLSVENHLGLVLQDLSITDGTDCYHLAQLKSGERQVAQPVTCQIPDADDLHSVDRFFGYPLNQIADALLSGQYGRRFFWASTPQWLVEEAVIAGETQPLEPAHHVLLGVW